MPVEVFEGAEMSKGPRLQMLWKLSNGRRGDESTILSLFPDGSDPRRVASQDVLRSSDVNGIGTVYNVPVRSPDNRYLLLGGHLRQAGHTHFLIDLKEQTSRPLVEGRGDGDFNWTSDSRHAYFHGGSKHDGMEVFRYDVETGILTTLSQAPKVFFFRLLKDDEHFLAETENGFGIFDLQWNLLRSIDLTGQPDSSCLLNGVYRISASPSGLVLFSCASGNLSMILDAAAPEPLSTPLYRSQVDMQEATFGPEEQDVYWVDWKKRGELFRLDLKTGQSKSLNAHVPYGFGLRVFNVNPPAQASTANKPAAEPKAALTEAKSSDDWWRRPELVPEEGLGGSLKSRSPRLQFMWVDDHEGRQSIWSVALDGTDLRRVVSSDSLGGSTIDYEGTPMRSPNSRHLALRVTRPGHAPPAFLVVDLKDGKPRLAMDNIHSAMPVWSPDSRHLYFDARDYDLESGVAARASREFTGNLLAGCGGSFVIRGGPYEDPKRLDGPAGFILYDLENKIVREVPLEIVNSSAFWRGYTVFSPDGRLVKYQVRGQAVVIDTEKPDSPLYQGDIFMPAAAFGPTQTDLYYIDASRPGGGGELFRLDLKTGKSTSLKLRLPNGCTQLTLYNVH